MKRIAQVVQHLSPGGIETLVLDLQRFSLPGEQVHIVSLEGRKPHACQAWSRLDESDAQLHFLDKPAGLSAATLWRLLRLLRELRIDAVHTHHIGPLLYGGLAARLAGVTDVIHTEHDIWHLNDARRRKVERLALALVRPHLVADAKVVAAGLKIHFPTSHPTVIHNGIDTDKFSPGDKQTARRVLGLPQQVPMIGCAARLQSVKGHAVLLDALLRINKQVHLVLAGDGPMETELRNQVRDRYDERRVHFLGRVDDMPTFYRALDVFCLPSLNEGMPLSPLEAQACGIPSVVTDVGGCSESLCPNTGSLVPANDALALANALDRQLETTSACSPRDFVVQNADVHSMTRAYARLRGAA